MINFRTFCCVCLRKHDRLENLNAEVESGVTNYDVISTLLPQMVTTLADYLIII